MLFDSALEKQLVLRGHMTPEEYADVRRDIKYDFKQDNYFTELKENEVLTERVNTLALIDPFVGKYFSEDWVKRNVLRMSDDEILELDKAVEADHDQNTEMDAALADPDLGANNVDGKQGPPQ